MLNEKQGTFRAVAVRYQVKNVDRAVAFYTQQLGFKLEQQSAPAFARVSIGCRPTGVLRSGHF